MGKYYLETTAITNLGNPIVLEKEKRNGSCYTETTYEHYARYSIRRVLELIKINKRYRRNKEAINLLKKVIYE